MTWVIFNLWLCPCVRSRNMCFCNVFKLLWLVTAVALDMTGRCSPSWRLSFTLEWGPSQGFSLKTGLRGHRFTWVYPQCQKAPAHCSYLVKAFCAMWILTCAVCLFVFKRLRRYVRLSTCIFALKVQLNWLPLCSRERNTFLSFVLSMAMKHMWC